MRKALQKFRLSWLGLVIGAILVTIPPALEKLAEKPANPWLPSPLVDAFSAHPILNVLCEFWPVMMALGFLILEKFCSTAPDEFPESRGLIALIVQLANTVGMKSACLHCKAAAKLGVAPKTIHHSSPDAQMKALVSGVWQIFNLEARENGLDENKVVKVTLAEMEISGVFKSFRAFHPMNLQPQVPASFYGKNTGFATAATTRQILILQDLEKELRKPKRRYAASNDHDIGSMICFPIDIQPLSGKPEIPLVLCIKCDKVKAFKISKQERYLFLIQPFADRIRLEYYNEVIEG